MTKTVSFAAIIFVAVIATAHAQVSWKRLTITEANALRQSENTTVLATGQFRAGGVGPEIRVQDGLMNLSAPFESADLTWDFDGGANTISAQFGTPEVAGRFELAGFGALGSSGSANVLPTTWFNQVLFDFVSPFASILISGNLNGENFSLSTDYLADGDDMYDAIVFSWWIPHGTSPTFNMTATMSFVDAEFTPLIQDDFLSNVQLIQNVDVIPEPDIANIQMSEGNIQLSFSGPQNGFPFVIEETSDLVSGIWTTTKVVDVQLESLVLTNSIMAPIRFWRIRRQ